MCQLVLPQEPATQPLPRMAVHGSIRDTDGAETEVVRPSQKHPVESVHSVSHLRPEPFPARLVADLSLEAGDRLRRRSRPDGGLTRLRRPEAPDRVTQEVERLLGDSAQPRLR